MMKNYYRNYLPLIMLLPAVGLVGCGGSSSDSTPGSTRTIGVVQSVTPDGQITVSGTTFSTGGATISGDVSSGTGNPIDPGMKVVVDGSVDSSGKTGTAHHIEYDAEVEGKVMSNDCTGTLPCSMDVMGQTIQVNDATHFRSNMAGVDSVHMIMAGAYVEVSGYSDGNGNIVATYVKVEDDHMESSYGMEVEGKVTNLTDSTFEIGGQLIHYDPSSINMTLQEGMCVEVYLRDDGMGNMHVIDVEPEEEYGDDSKNEVEIEGMITSDGVAADGTFEINGQTVMLSDNVRFEGGLTQADIVKNAIMEVEGYRDENGMLVVTKVGSEDETDDSSDDSTDSSSNDTSTPDTSTPDTSTDTTPM